MPKKEKSKSEKTKEVFEMGDKEIVKESSVENPIKNKDQEKHQEKVLKNILFSLALLVLLVFGYYLFAQSQITMHYKDIEFKAASYGKDLIVYETQTLLPARDGTNSDFGFRIRTKPSKLKKIPFDSADNLELMKINGVQFENGTFNCNGDGVIAMPNLERLFEKIGTQYIVDDNATCSPDGYYNLFMFKYGNETRINEVGNHCYEVIVKGNDDSCEILPATEKIMVEVFSKYKEFTGK